MAYISLGTASHRFNSTTSFLLPSLCLTSSYPPEVSHDAAYATQPSNLDNLLMPAQQNTHSRAGRLVRSHRALTDLAEPGSLGSHGASGRRPARAIGGGGRGAHAFVPIIILENQTVSCISRLGLQLLGLPAGSETK